MDAPMLMVWLPFPEPRLSVQCLAFPELKKQRLDAMRLIFLADKGEAGDWNSYTSFLALYGYLACTEARVRGYPCRLRPFFWKRWRDEGKELELPPWIGDDRVHLDHKVRLYRINPAHYGRFWPEVAVCGTIESPGVPVYHSEEELA